MTTFTPSIDQINFAFDLVELKLKNEEIEEGADIVMSRSIDLFENFLHLVQTIAHIFEPTQDGKAEFHAGATTQFWINKAIYCMTRASEHNQTYLEKIRPLIVETAKSGVGGWLKDREEIADVVVRFPRLFRDALERTPRDQAFRVFDTQGNPTVAIGDAINFLPEKTVDDEFNALYSASHQVAATALNAVAKHSKEGALAQAQKLAGRAIKDCLNSTNPLYQMVCLATHPLPGEYVGVCLKSLMGRAHSGVKASGSHDRSIAFADLLDENPDYVKHALGQDLFRYATQDNIAKDLYTQPELLMPIAKVASKHGLDILGLSCAYFARTWFASTANEKQREEVAVRILLNVGTSPYFPHILGKWYLHTTPHADLLKLPLPDRALESAYKELGSKAFLEPIRDKSALDRVLSLDLGL